MCSVPTVPRVVLGNTVPLAQTVSTVLPARTLSLEVPWSQIASALLAWAARMAARARCASRASTRRWQDRQRALTAKSARILHLSEQLNRRHA